MYNVIKNAIGPVLRKTREKQITYILHKDINKLIYWAEIIILLTKPKPTDIFILER